MVIIFFCSSFFVNIVAKNKKHEAKLYRNPAATARGSSPHQHLGLGFRVEIRRRFRTQLKTGAFPIRVGFLLFVPETVPSIVAASIAVQGLEGNMLNLLLA